MQPGKLLSFVGIAAALAFRSFGVGAQITSDAPANGRPVAIVNLATAEGVQLVKGQ